MPEITRDAKYVLAVLLEMYKRSIADGESRVYAKMLGEAKDIYQKYKEYSFGDLEELFRELHRAGYLMCSYGDDKVNEVVLTDLAIIYMETKFESNLNNILDYIVKFREAFRLLP